MFQCSSELAIRATIFHCSCECPYHWSEHSRVISSTWCACTNTYSKETFSKETLHPGKLVTSGKMSEFICFSRKHIFKGPLKYGPFVSPSLKMFSSLPSSMVSTFSPHLPVHWKPRFTMKVFPTNQFLPFFLSLLFLSSKDNAFQKYGSVHLTISPTNNANMELVYKSPLAQSPPHLWRPHQSLEAFSLPLRESKRSKDGCREPSGESHTLPKQKPCGSSDVNSKCHLWFSILRQTFREMLQGLLREARGRFQPMSNQISSISSALCSEVLCTIF